MLEAHVLDLLDGLDELGVLKHRVIAKNVHVEAGALLDDGLPDASGADDGHGLARHLIAQERQVGMPVVPAVLTYQLFPVPQFARERSQNKECELGGSLGENVRSVGERNFVAIGIGAVDVVESNGQLGDNLQRAFPCLEDLGVDLVADGRDESVHSGAQLLENHLLRRRLRMRIDLDLIFAVAQYV